MKCRGCGRVGGNGKDVEGLGWMHHECEVNRLTHALEESESLLARAEAERDIADKQLSALCEGVNRRCGADNNQLPLVSLDRIVAANERLTQQVANGRMEADRLLKVVFARDARLAAAEAAAQPLSLHSEVASWRAERDEIKQRLAATEADLAECRRLLREACGSCYDQCLYVDKDWYKAARAAGGVE